MKETDFSSENEKSKYCCIKTVLKPFIWIDELGNNLISHATNAMIGGRLGDIINQSEKKLPEYDYMKSEYDETLNNFRDQYPALKCENFQIEVNNKTSLQTIDIKNENNKENNYLVVFMGNGEMLEGRIRRLAKMSKDFNCNVRSFNYRGKGESTGRAKRADDLVEDGMAEVNDLLKSGVEPEKITVYGKCLGAAVGALIAEDMHSKGQKVKVALDLPFSKLTSMYIGTLRLQKIPNKNVKHLKRKKLLLRIKKPFIRATIVSSKWEMDVKKAYLSIPEDYKMFFQIRSRNQIERTQNLLGDGVIADEASLGYSLEKELLKKQDNFKSKINKLEKKITLFESKTHKNEKTTQEINSFKTKICEFEKNVKDIDNKLSELQKTEILEVENPLNEDYKGLSYKQECIRLIHRLDNILPRVIDIVKELGEMRAAISDDPNIDGVLQLKKAKNPQEILALEQKYGERRAQIEQSLVDLTYELKNKKRQASDLDQIEDVDLYAHEFADSLISKIAQNVRFVMDMPELRDSECMYLLIEDKGLTKLGHNKDLKDLHYVYNDMSADVALNKFINKPMKIEAIRSKSLDHNVFESKRIPC